MKNEKKDVVNKKKKGKKQSNVAVFRIFQNTAAFQRCKIRRGMYVTS